MQAALLLQLQRLLPLACERQTVRTHGARVPTTSVTVARGTVAQQGAKLHHAASGWHICPSAFAMIVSGQMPSFANHSKRL